MIHFGFSYVGLILLILLFLPNIIWTKNKPKDYENYVKKENKVLLAFERIGEILVCCFAVIFSDFNLRTESLWTVWLLLAGATMIVYECYWIHYFRSEKNMSDFYRSFLGVPVAGATLPVIAFSFLGIYGCNIFMLVAVIILGIGHIGIHVRHRNEVCPPKKKRRILKWIGRVVLSLVLLLFLLVIVAKNYQWIKNSIHTENGIEEEAYLNLCGQEQYCLMRGEDVSNPVIIWIHGGPASPDTLETFYLSNYLKDDYTVIAWNQRGCGRTYFRNKDSDPYNRTATFNQVIDDLDALVDYARERFGQKQVIIVGHSFGTMVGCQYTMLHPEKVSKYVGVGQMGAAESDVYAFMDALEQAKKCGDSTTKMEEALKRYQNDPSIVNMMLMRPLADKYHKVPNTHNAILDAIISPYIGVDDARWFSKQLYFKKFVKQNQLLFDYICKTDVYDFGVNFQVPVGFISGSCDWVTPVQYTKDFYDAIKAPEKKMTLIDGWGHSVPQENPKKFASVLKKMLQDLSEQ